ncbi:MAG: RNA polymerase sigma factor [Gemmatimonadota bacterium]|nr:MAG: RNA polymerase sigma factor [Gemmatimonadota bacterium]
MRSRDPSDAELAAAAQAGDREAFGRLVERYVGQARRLARAFLGNGADADDAAQDAFLAAFRNLGRYDLGRPFGPWLMRIVANAAADRRRRRKVRATEEIPAGTADSRPDPERQTLRRELRDVLEHALAALPERRRMAVVLFDVEGYSHQEIADVLEVPVGTVRSDVYHARRALREVLAARGFLEEET